MRTLPDTLVLPQVTVQGSGSARRLIPACQRFGQRGVLVHGRSLERNDQLSGLLSGVPPGLTVETHCHTGGEPTLADLEGLLAHARRCNADWIAAIGGGSVLDLGKACAGLFRCQEDLTAVHNGAPLAGNGIPFAAAPATAGTGSEATPVCVLTHPLTREKKSIRHPSFLPSIVALDPLLLAHCPPGVIAASGMDAWVQALEAYASQGATWWSDMLALKALTLIDAHIEPVFRNPEDPGAAELLTGSYLAGLALSSARLGIVHGLAHPLGARYRIPHGLVCAVCMAPALELNRPFMGEKYNILSQTLVQDPLTRVAGLLNALGLNGKLFEGRPCPDRAAIIRETLASGSTAANPKRVTSDDVEAILDRLFGSDQARP